MLQNHPTFFIALFAASKIGATPSLINTNLSDDSLFHCIQIAKTKLFLFDPIYAPQVETIAHRCQEIHAKIVSYGETTFESELSHFHFANALNLSTLACFSDRDLDDSYLKKSKASDPAFLIYTRYTKKKNHFVLYKHLFKIVYIYSGTTGMPKVKLIKRVSLSLIFYDLTYIIHRLRSVNMPVSTVS